MIANTIKLLFYCYTLFLFARVICSWIPQWRDHILMRFVSYYTDPYLNVFRRLVPPVGGMLDLSPLFGLLFLQLLQKIILNFIR